MNSLISNLVKTCKSPKTPPAGEGFPPTIHGGEMAFIRIFPLRKLPEIIQLTEARRQ
jgi:hypothetical protein